MTPKQKRARVREHAAAEEAFLLDTHVWIWMLADDQRRMPAGSWRILSDAADRGALHVSDLSCWEVALKVARGRYALGLPLDEWFEQAIAAPGVTMLPLDRPILVLGARLTAMRGDPADRWLVATAKLHGLTLVTADEAILKFAKDEGMTSVLDARG